MTLFKALQLLYSYLCLFISGDGLLDKKEFYSAPWKLGPDWRYVPVDPSEEDEYKEDDDDDIYDEDEDEDDEDEEDEWDEWDNWDEDQEFWDDMNDVDIF